jgi:hypothetical protein
LADPALEEDPNLEVTDEVRRAVVSSLLDRCDYQLLITATDGTRVSGVSAEPMMIKMSGDGGLGDGEVLAAA